MKHTLSILTLALFLAFSASSLMAQPKDEAPAAPKKFEQISPEDRAAFMELRKNHHQKTYPLREQLWAKQMEYDALVANPNSKHSDIKAVIDDMSKLRAQLNTERENFFSQAESKGLMPHKAGFGPHRGGFDGGPCAYGDGSGPGFHKKGKWDGRHNKGGSEGRHHNW